jgi:hypothetical protein
MNVPFFKKKAFQQNWNAFRDKIVMSGNFPVLLERFFFFKKVHSLSWKAFFFTTFSLGRYRP